MKNLENYYRENISAYTQKADHLKKKIHIMGSLRLALFIGAFFALYICRAESGGILTLITLAFVIPFALLMLYHTKLQEKRMYAEALIRLNKDELNGLNYDFSAFDGAAEKIDGSHPFGLDLDLFGNQSIFQSINRTVTASGKELLADWFISPLTEKQDILKRQEAIQELASLAYLRQHFYVTGILSPGNINDAHRLIELTNSTPLFLNSKLPKILIWLIPAIWLITLIGTIFNFIDIIVPGLLFPFCFVIANLRAKDITALHNSVNKMEKILSTYSELIKSIEGDTFHSSLLQNISTQFLSKNGTASHSIKQLSQYIGALDQRFSLAGILLNIFLLRDTRQAINLERWKLIHSNTTKNWFKALAKFDALSSLAGFAFNHPNYIYPQIADSYFCMEGKALGHPLLHRDKCVRNDIDIKKSPWFLIITGANMAGKSTYLRTIGVNYLLACIGAPVWADSLTLYPAKLVTSLRTADSLVSNESYFFAELKRLKMIIDRLQNGEELFIILDEILKGTNSIDKQKGSLALMKQLITCRTCGIIATHDLVLGTLEGEFPNQIKNYRFEADITNEELTFSYQLREGIAQNMNACFLMKKMGITI